MDHGAREGEMMIAIRYRASAIIGRIIIFQFIPIILAIKLAFGRVERPELLDIVLAVTVVLYTIMMVMMVRAVQHPVILAVGHDGGLRWRPMFRHRHYRLPAGSTVTVTEKELTVAPAMAGVAGTVTRDGDTVFRLPGCIYPTVTGVWRV